MTKKECWVCERVKPLNRFGMCEKCWASRMGPFWEEETEDD